MSVAQRLPSTASIPRQPESSPTSSPPSRLVSPPSILVSPASANVHSVPHQLLSTPVTASFISNRGEQYTESIFALSTDLTEREHQTRHLEALESRFTAAKLRRHTFTWDSHRREWVPIYAFYVRPSGAASVKDVWHEHIFGIDGQLSVRQISAHWGTRWRRNSDGLKTEQSRRKKITDLMDKLTNTKKWEEDRAITFIEDAFVQGEGNRPCSARAVHDWMTKRKKGISNVEQLYSDAGL